MIPDEFHKEPENIHWSDLSREEREEVLRRRTGEMRKIEEPFIADIKKNGYHELNSVEDIMKLKRVDGKLTELLLAWIPKIEKKHFSQEFMVRSLAISKVSFDGTTLTSLFDEEDSSFFLKWAIANTIAGIKLQNVTPWLEHKLASDTLGKEFERFMYAIARYFPYETASGYLWEWFEDFPLQAADALRMIGKQRDLDFMEGKIGNYNKGPVRTAINNAIKKLKKRLEKRSASIK